MSLPIVVTTQASHDPVQGWPDHVLARCTPRRGGQSADVLLGVERLNPEEGDLAAVDDPTQVLASRVRSTCRDVLRWDWSHGSVQEMDPRQFRKEPDDGSQN